MEGPHRPQRGSRSITRFTMRGGHGTKMHPTLTPAPSCHPELPCHLCTPVLDPWNWPPGFPSLRLSTVTPTATSHLSPPERARLPTSAPAALLPTIWRRTHAQVDVSKVGVFHLPRGPCPARGTQRQGRHWGGHGLTWTGAGTPTSTNTIHSFPPTLTATLEMQHLTITSQCNNTMYMVNCCKEKWTGW